MRMKRLAEMAFGAGYSKAKAPSLPSFEEWWTDVGLTYLDREKEREDAEKPSTKEQGPPGWG